MIAVDTSALMAIMLAEPQAEACKRALMAETEVVMSAGTVAEARIVATLRGLGDRVNYLLEDLRPTIIDVTPATAKRVAAIYGRWGKGMNPASLNFGDCFAYDVAKEHNCPLLFVGNDFARTDIPSALQSASRP